MDEIQRESKEMTEKHSSIVWVQHNDRILVVWNRNYGGFCMPGGKVEPNESFIAAAKRELREETDLIASDDNLEEVYAAPSGTASERTVHVFHVFDPKLLEGTAKEMEIGCPITWLTPAEIIDRSAFKSFYEKMFSHFSVNVKVK